MKKLSTKKESFNNIMNKQTLGKESIKKKSSIYKKRDILNEGRKSYIAKNPFALNFDEINKLEKSMDNNDLVYANDAESNFNDSYFQDQSEISEAQNENSSIDKK
jgi:hypothetical protein